MESPILRAVGIGIGVGSEFYRPMALAIIAGTITATLLTLLVIPSFYDSIKTARDRALAKFHAREARWNPFFAFGVTLVEALQTLVLLRAVWRGLKLQFAALRGGGGAQRAAAI